MPDISEKRIRKSFPGVKERRERVRAREKVTRYKQQWRFYISEKGGGQKLQKGKHVEERQSGSEGFCEKGICAVGRCGCTHAYLHPNACVFLYTQLRKHMCI